MGGPRPRCACRCLPTRQQRAADGCGVPATDRAATRNGARGRGERPAADPGEGGEVIPVPGDGGGPLLPAAAPPAGRRCSRRHLIPAAPPPHWSAAPPLGPAPPGRRIAVGCSRHHPRRHWPVRTGNCRSARIDGEEGGGNGGPFRARYAGNCRPAAGSAAPAQRLLGETPSGRHSGPEARRRPASLPQPSPASAARELLQQPRCWGRQEGARAVLPTLERPACGRTEVHGAAMAPLTCSPFLPTWAGAEGRERALLRERSGNGWTTTSTHGPVCSSGPELWKFSWRCLLERWAQLTPQALVFSRKIQVATVLFQRNF